MVPTPIFVIAGHGDGDPGACAFNFTEAERVRTLAGRIKDLGGSNVILGDVSRDYYKDNGIASLNISKRYQIVELHMDNNSSPQPKGGHVVIKQGFEPDDFDRALADNIASLFPGRASKIVGRNDLQNVDVAANRGYGYRLVECGFISNREDLNTFNNRTDDVAKAILSAFGIVPNPSVKPSEKPAAKPNRPVASYNGPKLAFTYSVRAGGKVWPEVTDLSDWAGKGDGVPLTGIAVKANVGTVKTRVHILNGEWLPWVTGYDWNDEDNGYAGNGEPIDGVQIYYYTPDDYVAKYGYEKADYRVSSLEGREYYDWQHDDETHSGQDGYAGKLGVAIDKFQLF